MPTPSPILKTLPADAIVPPRRDPVDPAALAGAAEIVSAVRDQGEPAVRRFRALHEPAAPADAPLVLGKADMRAARESLAPDTLACLRRAASRIEQFARLQRDALDDITFPVEPGIQAGHEAVPVQRAGCYAPGGRHPLPSSVLMTAVTARVAGVAEVIVCSPSNHPLMLAAADIAGADAFVHLGGAHAVAALAYGAGPIPACDAVVGPGNKWVTAAKQLVAGRVAIDMLAGPSEVLVIADDTADPAAVAADLLAQAEHDTDARVYLVSLSAPLIHAVNEHLEQQLQSLPTAATAREALRNSAACLVTTPQHAAAVADRVAPEHLQIMTANPWPLAGLCHHFGAVFVGHGAAEALGDYGLGPNHTLPTSGSARSFAGLSVFTFLRIRTWIRAEAPAHPDVYHHTAALARMEGLEAHARSAERRLPRAKP